MKLSMFLCRECSTCIIFFSSSFTVSMIALFLSGYNVFIAIFASKNLQKTFAIQNISIILSSVIIANFVCNSLFFSTIKLQQISLIAKFINTYNSSNSR